MRGRVDDIYDVLSEGQIVDVWISGKKDDGKFGLTMVEGVKDGENARPVTCRDSIMNTGPGLCSRPARSGSSGRTAESDSTAE